MRWLTCCSSWVLRFVERLFAMERRGWSWSCSRRRALLFNSSHATLHQVNLYFQAFHFVVHLPGDDLQITNIMRGLWLSWRPRSEFVQHRSERAHVFVELSDRILDVAKLSPVTLQHACVIADLDLQPRQDPKDRAIFWRLRCTGTLQSSGRRY